MPAYVYYAARHGYLGEVIWGAAYEESIAKARAHLTSIYEDTYNVTPNILEVHAISTQLIKQAAKELEAKDGTSASREN